MDIETKVKVWQLVVFLLALVSLCYDVVFLAMTNDPEWWVLTGISSFSLLIICISPKI